MRVVFDLEVLALEDSWRELDRILETVEDGWHLWEIPDLDATEESVWLQQGRPWLRGLFEATARRSAWQSPGGLHHRRILVVLEPEVTPESPEEGTDGTLHLAPQVARLFLGQPLRILMENIESDGLFLDAILDVLGTDELRELRTCTPPALEYDSPGGSELPKRIEHYLDDPAWQGIPRRLFVFTDSDRLTHGGDLAPDSVARQVTKLCKDRDVPYRVLRKRAIENYLPQEALEAWAASPGRTSVRPRVAMMARLDTEQRDYFPMKLGFLKGIPKGQEDLFAAPRWLEEDRSNFLRPERWFGPDIVHLFRDHRDAITPEALRRRCGPVSAEDGTTELDQLVALICAEL
ncbi:MAG: hypothetical protein GY722_19600 [bacterium]|nr:hypothetical protein [bacterium]